jgi:hypothetical protein
MVQCFLVVEVVVSVKYAPDVNSYIYSETFSIDTIKQQSDHVIESAPLIFHLKYHLNFCTRAQE